MTTTATWLHNVYATSTSRVIRVIAKAGWLSLIVCAATRGDALIALARFWRWQCERRLGRPALAVRLEPQGILFHIPAWSRIGGMIVATGSHEQAETSLLARVVRTNDVFVDVGANIGLYTVLAARAGARVVAFEPDAQAQRALQRNVAVGGVEGIVETWAAALADYDGEASFTTGLDVTNHLADELRPSQDTGDRVTVAVRTIDSLHGAGQIPVAEAGCLALLKVDAEGHDMGVLRGAIQWLAECTPVIMVETWNGGHDERAFLYGLGYRVYSYAERPRVLREYPPDWHGQANFIAVRPEQMSRLKARLSNDRRPTVLSPPQVLGWVTA